jgi:hypothetical protein
MNEMAGYSALSGGLHDNHRASVTEAPLHLYGRVGRSCAQALAGSFAALITVTGCVTTGGGAGNNQSSESSSGGPSSLAAVQSARTSQNAVARDQAIRLQDQQRQQALEARRIERREAALEAIRQRQITADRIALQQEQEKAKQVQQQANQGRGPQGNQGRRPQGNQGVGQGGVPPGQAKK